MARLQRYDLGTLEKPRETPQGFLIVEGFASRTGTQDYYDQDGNVRTELRLEEDVFAPESLDTFLGASMTDDHPGEFVTVVTVDGVQCGTVLGAGVRDGDYVRVQMVITDPDLIAKMRDGKRQLSVGYTVEHDEEPGVHPTFGKYDAIQRKIIVNHLAVVDEGRAGPIASARMDAGARVARVAISGTVLAAAPRVRQHANHMPNPNPKVRKDDEPAPEGVAPGDAPPDMNILKTLAESMARCEELLKQLAAANAAKDAETAKAVEAEAGKVEAEAATENAKADAKLANDAAIKAKADAETAIATAKAAIDATFADAVLDRVALEFAAMRVLGEKDAEGKRIDRRAIPDRTLKLEIIKRVDGKDVPDVNGKPRPDHYVEALYDGAVERFTRGATSLADARTALTPPPVGTTPPGTVAPGADEETARLALRDHYNTAWERLPRNAVKES